MLHSLDNNRCGFPSLLDRPPNGSVGRTPNISTECFKFGAFVLRAPVGGAHHGCDSKFILGRNTEVKKCVSPG